MSQTRIDDQLLEAAVRARRTPSLDGVRSAALARFLSGNLPSTRDEDWKYTGLGPVARISNQWLATYAAAESARKPAPARPENVDAHWLELRNGRIDDDNLQALNAALDGRIVARRLSAAADQHELYIEDAVSSLNAALMEDALCIDVAANAHPDRPIVILLDDDAGDGAVVSQVRILVRVGAGANVDFVEMHRSRGASEHYANTVCELRLDDGATANYLKIQERAGHHIQTGRLNVSLGANSRLEHASVDLGGTLIRNDVHAALTRPGAHFGTAGLYLTDGDRHVDNHVCADHRVGPATSEQIYRGIAAGKSRCVFNGKAIVREGADGTDARQSNHSLLLSNKAEIDTKPELEIYADDVKCSHGATVGQLDENALFYLRSRGLSADQAAQLLTRAFVNAVLEIVPVGGLRGYVDEATDRRLDQIIEGRDQ